MTMRFYASVSPDALDRVSRLFKATLPEILVELIQNSRRAGATRIEALDTHMINGWHGPAIQLRDNGSGIDDPKTVLCLGSSDWDDVVAMREDPAGMGIFSLARRGAVIA